MDEGTVFYLKCAAADGSDVTVCVAESAEELLKQFFLWVGRYGFRGEDIAYARIYDSDLNPIVELGLTEDGSASLKPLKANPAAKLLRRLRRKWWSITDRGGKDEWF